MTGKHPSSGDHPFTPELVALLADLVSFRVTNDAGECSWCEADNPVRTTDHRPTCPWRRAQEIVHASR